MGHPVYFSFPRSLNAQLQKQCPWAKRIPGTRTQINLDILNLFDRKANDIEYYYASRLQGEPASGVNDIHLHPAEPRTFRVSLVTHF